MYNINQMYILKNIDQLLLDPEKELMNSLIDETDNKDSKVIRYRIMLLKQICYNHQASLIYI